MKNGKKRFILVDANSIIHRAYHAYPSHLSTSKGEQVNAVYGFSTIVLKVIEDLKPDMIICAFDVETKPTFRNKIYGKYKSTRKSVDKELVAQIPRIKEVLNAFDIPILEVEGFEADDLIGTLERQEDVQDFEKIIVTGDQDMFQLVDKDTKVFLSGRNFRDSRIYEEGDVKNKVGVKPSQVIDYKAIYGDPSDNIPGVKGIGKKGAIDLLNDFKSLKGIYRNIKKVSSRYRNKLAKQRSEAFMSYKLAKIKNDIEIRYDLERCKWGKIDISKVEVVFRKLEFRSLIRRVGNLKVKKYSNSKSIEKSEGIKEYNTVDIERYEDTRKFVRRALRKKLICIFIEISDEGIYPYHSGLIFISIESTIYKIDLKRCFDKGGNLLIGKEIKGILENENIRKVGFDIKKIMHLLLDYNIQLKGPYFDIKIAAYILQGGKGKSSLANLAFSYLGEVYDLQLELGSSAADTDYVVKRIQIVCKLYDKLSAELDKINKNKWNLKRLFYDVEMPLVKILFEMESNGILIDTKYLLELQEEFDKDIVSIEKKVFKCIGHDFNLCSPKQVSDVLFGELSLPKTRRNKSGSYSTSSYQLQDLKSAHPAVGLILQYRELSKLRSTYTSPLIDTVDKKTGRIHTTYNQAITATGRLTSSEPNLQNIPISTDIGRKVRRAFIAKKGASFISFDIAQQELRILAHLADEDSLIEAFNKNIDVHALTASKIFEKEISKVTRKERRIGKTINFGVMYGMSERGLSQAIGITYKQAEDFIIKYFDKYSKVRNYFDNYLNEANKKGYAETLFGRRKKVGSFKNLNVFTKQAIQRELINFPIQGTAADMMKLAMIKVDKILDKKYRDKSKMILQIHDELIFEFIGKLGIREFKSDVRKSIEGVYPFKAPIKVEISEGRNLREIH